MNIILSINALKTKIGVTHENLHGNFNISSGLLIHFQFHRREKNKKKEEFMHTAETRKEYFTNAQIIRTKPKKRI